MPEVIINGPEGRIEARYTPSKKSESPIALILHPEPNQGGTMNNKVIFGLYREFVKRDFSTLRFNFRGVGKSQGSYDDGEGELADAATAMDWIQTQNPNATHCWVAGFSFGAWIGMQLMMRRPEIKGFLSLSAPALSKDFAFLAPLWDCRFQRAFAFAWLLRTHLLQGPGSTTPPAASWWWPTHPPRRRRCPRTWRTPLPPTRPPLALGAT